jgi:DNA-binding response OmpR family regulator
MNILYVENHDVFVSVVRREFLKDHHLIVVPTVAKAIFEFDKSGFDLVLTDYDLDDGKGSEVIEYIRRTDDVIPIIAVSSHSRGNEAMIEVGANAICSKMKFENLNKVISGLINGGA